MIGDLYHKKCRKLAKEKLGKEIVVEIALPNLS